MSLIEDLLNVLSDFSGDYPKICARLRNLQESDRNRFNKSKIDNPLSSGSIRATLSRLKQKGLVENKNKKWKISKSGQSLLKKKSDKKLNLPNHTVKKRSSEKRNMIIIFDIPEKERSKRDWLRVELFNLGFVLLQKSVWFGPAPLPRDFIESIGFLKLTPYLKFFEAKEKDII